MSPGDKEALEALNRRIDHTAATARLLSLAPIAEPDVASAMNGIAQALMEVAERIDALANA